MAAGSKTVSPAFSPLRMIVEVLPASPVIDAPAHILAAAHHCHRAAEMALRGNVHAFGLFDDDFSGGAHAGLQARVHLVELECDVIAHDPALLVERVATSLT